MKRLAGRASALVVFFLLASAGTAFAEWAWVLWGPTPRVAQEKSRPEFQMYCPSGICELSDKWPLSIDTGTFTICGAVESRNECEEEHSKFSRGTKVWSSFVCLPDTMDPRGPKGR